MLSDEKLKQVSEINKEFANNINAFFANDFKCIDEVKKKNKIFDFK
jgi:hypothetical protein